MGGPCSGTRFALEHRARKREQCRTVRFFVRESQAIAACGDSCEAMAAAAAAVAAATLSNMRCYKSACVWLSEFVQILEAVLDLAGVRG